MRKKGARPAEVYPAAAQALRLSVATQTWEELAGIVQANFDNVRI